MESKRHKKRTVVNVALLLAGLAMSAAMSAAPAAAQLVGDLRYGRGYDLYPIPLVTGEPVTLILYGIYPTGCGAVVSRSESGPVELRLKSFATCPDSAIGTWAESFSLGAFTAGLHTVSITATMERPDSGLIVDHATLTFDVLDSIPPTSPPPPDSTPVLPPPRPSAPAVVVGTVTNPSVPTPDVPIAVTVFGTAPFRCPVVSDAAVLDSTHLALTLTHPPSCGGDTAQAWSHTFELGLQRAGHHPMDLAITLGSDSVVHVPIDFLVYENPDHGGPPVPADSLEHVLSQARPNPFVSESRFSVSLDNAADAHVAVFDILGRRVSTVFSGRLQPGTTELRWNGRHDDGRRATAGVYFYRLEMGGRVVSRRLVLLRPQ